MDKDSELFKGKTLLRGPAAVRFENITELLKDETFKKLSDKGTSKAIHTPFSGNDR